MEHANRPFVVKGVLAHTGTPVDRSVHVSLEAIEAIHVDWKDGAPPLPGQELSEAQIRSQSLAPTQITAFLIGLKSKTAIFRVQRAINDYKDEPLLAILPGATFQELWRTVGMAETALMVISAFVVVTGLIGMLTAILTSLNERRREMAILRSVGAHPRDIFFLLFSEAAVLAVTGCGAGLALLYLILFSCRGLLERRFGLYLPLTEPDMTDWLMLGSVLVAGALTGLLPAMKAYRNSLSDGLSIRL
jgi:putative ABC transport system permease protein